jgi:hypoxanthine phosphoribosyltransferase
VAGARFVVEIVRPLQLDPPALVVELLALTPLARGIGPIDVACSGGPDSTALAALASATDREVTLHHVDHGLRAASSHESTHVKELAASLGVGFVAHVVDVEDGSNLEARARSARLGVLPFEAATGHTMDDQAETVILNLMRGTGIDGLAAMEMGDRHPLLALRRHQTHELCRALGLSVVVDESNDDLRMTRNKVRAQVIPLMNDVVSRDVVPLLARLAGVARGDLELLDELAAQAVPDPLDVAALRSVPAPLASRALRAWIRGERQGLDSPFPPSEAEVRRILSVVNGDSRATQLSGGLSVARTRGRLRLEREASGTLTPMNDAAHAAGPPQWAAHDLGEVIVSAEAIRDRVAELGAAITADYAESPPLLVCVLKGAMHFMSDLAQAIQLPVDVDFMAVSSYGSATQTSGVVRIVKDLDADLSGRHVLVVEDIIDSGLTLNYLRKYLSARGPASIEVCALLLKEGEQRIEPDYRYVGFTIPSAFVVGYGLDVAEKYRNLDGIYTYVGEGTH